MYNECLQVALMLMCKMGNKNIAYKLKNAQKSIERELIGMTKKIERGQHESEQPQVRNILNIIK